MINCKYTCNLNVNIKQDFPLLRLSMILKNVRTNVCVHNTCFQSVVILIEGFG